MSDPNTPESQTGAETTESFKDILSQYEKSHSRKPEPGSRGREGTVISVSSDTVHLDIGFKTEGILRLASFQAAGETLKPSDKLTGTVKGRDPEGYYELARFKVEQTTDWASLEKAFTDKATISGTVMAVVK